MAKTPETLNELFFGAVERFSSKRAALRFKEAGRWHDVSHAQLARQVKHAALGLRDLGIDPGQRVAILSHNCAEWATADFACLTAGCPNVPIYPTLPPTQIAYLLNDSESRAVFVDDVEQYEKLAKIRGEIPSVAHLIVFPDEIQGSGVTTLRELLQRGAARESTADRYREEALAVGPDDLASIIYTSGTTGEPKGVMMTHGNFCSNVTAVMQILTLGPDDSCLSYLPLSHSLERMAGHYTMFHAGATINYAEGVDQLGADMLEVRPTVMISVPRLFEKMYARVVNAAMRGGAVARRAFHWARRTGERYTDRLLDGAPIPAWLALKQSIADRLVFAKMRERTGGRLRFLVSGGAPLSAEIARFFYAAGLPVLEGYGLTETAPVIAVNTLDALRIGTVGRPIPGVEVRIAEDGEILARGPNIMQGYYRKPDATRAVVNEDGWFHTGDIGELDDDGFLTITDRKKDLIKTAGGKYVAPQPIENAVVTNSFVQNAVVIGNGRKFPSILVVPEFETVARWARGRGLPTDDHPALLSQPDVVAKIEREVMGCFRDLAAFERPKKVMLLEHDFTIERGELTPSLKVKRRVVEEHYRERIDRVYEEADGGGTPPVR